MLNQIQLFDIGLLFDMFMMASGSIKRSHSNLILFIDVQTSLHIINRRLMCYHALSRRNCTELKNQFAVQTNKMCLTSSNRRRMRRSDLDESIIDPAEIIKRIKIA